MIGETRLSALDPPTGRGSRRAEGPRHTASHVIPAPVRGRAWGRCGRGQRPGGSGWRCHRLTSATSIRRRSRNARRTKMGASEGRAPLAPPSVAQGRKMGGSEVTPGSTARGRRVGGAWRLPRRRRWEQGAWLLASPYEAIGQGRTASHVVPAPTLRRAWGQGGRGQSGHETPARPGKQGAWPLAPPAR